MSMYTFAIFTQLKNTDLHALSAYETITKVMGFTALQRLNRFGHWTLTLEAVTEEDARKKVTKILENSYYILNPNKESYSLEHLPKVVCRDTQSIRLIDVTQKIVFDDRDLRMKIQQKVGIPILKITKSLVWLMVIDSPNNASLEDTLTQEVIQTSSRTKGLLVNPFYETFTFMSEDVCSPD